MKPPGLNTWIKLIIPLSFALAALLFIAGESGAESADEKHDVTDWVKVVVNLADPLPPDKFEVIASVYVQDNGSWEKECNGTLGELYSKPDSPNSTLVDSANGTVEGIHLFTEKSGSYMVWAGVERDNRTYWNRTRIDIPPRNHAPVPIALLSTDNLTWANNLSVQISPGSGITIYFNGSLSYDPDGDSLDYYWDIDDTPPTTDLTGKWGHYYFSEAGLRKITLTVGDGKTLSSTVVLLNVTYDWRPDLTISGTPFLVPSDFKSGDTVEVTAIIYNKGNASAGHFRVYFYDHNLNTSKVRLIERMDVSGLKRNAYHGITFNWSTDRAERGIHVLEVFVDLDNTVKEENESNNVAWSRKFLVAPGAGEAPVLNIVSMTLSNETPVVFQMVNITLVINNTGKAPAEWVTVELLVSGEEYDFRYIPTIDAGEETRVQFFFSGSLIGSYNLTCVLYDNGIEQYRMGRRVVVKDIKGPGIVGNNLTNSTENSQGINYMIIGVGVFMIATAVVIDVIVRMEREKK